jgi:UDP-N-acetylmuramyl pentapeptide phosphotransferase/UDP-N-acetylglucosamine-1-phosphate transferase
MDIPNERSSHAHPVPRGGGLAIVAVSLSGLWLFAINWEQETPGLGLFAYTAGAILVAGVSWLDDLRSLSPVVRLVSHCLGASLAVWGMYSQEWSLLYPNWWILLLALLWVVWLTNAYNFMDGIDGIAGGQAVVAGVGWALLGWWNGLPFINILGLLLAASSLGFLCHNWPPARIFMGDVGSAFLGYTFAVITLWAGQKEPILFIGGVLLLWPFAFDALFTLLRRLYRRENVFQAHRSHLYQRLVARDFSHKWISALYVFLATLGGILAIGITRKWPGVEVIALVVVPLSALCLWGAVLWQEQKISERLPEV